MINLLSSSAFYIVNKKLSKILGIEAALLLADLISKNAYFENTKWFFNTENNILRDTTLSAYKQRLALKVLRDYKIIITKRKGTPAKQYFYINHDILMHLISCEEIEQLVVKDLDSKSEKNPTTINKNKEIKINNTHFKIPEFSDVELYCKERKNTIDVANFFNFYESKGWFIGKTKMKDWKACIRTWEARSKSAYVAPQNKESKLDSQLNEYLKGKKLL
jgi:hypothetical protein|tara:strand:- start:516 stop:1175 length:660 start_codon:yes stop_codon:yes gene_type:complete